MSKIKKIISILGILFINMCAFSFEINDLTFGEKILKGEYKSKEYDLINNSNSSKLYRFEIEEKGKNIKISPNILRLKPKENKKFTIKILGDKPKGIYKYFLVIKEINDEKDKPKNNVVLNKKVRVLQEYIIE